jgi:DNA-binding transcriptional LysR family regulator
MSTTKPVTRSTNLRSIDLNLLVVFDALVEEQSVRRAGDRVGLSQSATSHALERLRRYLDDEILVRTSTGMAATPRALTLAEPIRAALQQIQIALAPQRFDPASASDSFRIAVETYETITVVPQLVDEMRREAPGIELTVRSGSVDEILSGIDQGSVDIAIGRFKTLSDRLMTTRLMEDAYVCVMRKDHPLASRKFDLAAYLAAPQVMVSMSGAIEDDVDEALAGQDLRRRIVMRLPNGLAAAIALARSDMIATFTHGAARAFSQVEPLATYELPFAMPLSRFRLVWNRRLQDSPAHTWLRRKLVAIGEAAQAATLKQP